jgi:hypothetical protein
MEKKQTALDWYIEQNFNNIVQFESHQISQDEYVIAYNNLLNQAKAMEKEQIEDAYRISPNNELWSNSGIDYFNETYGGAE